METNLPGNIKKDIILPYKKENNESRSVKLFMACAKTRYSLMDSFTRESIEIRLK